MSDLTLVIGSFTEKVERVLTRCPGYYAADHETHRTTPGSYPLRLVFVGGYIHPMPYWLLISIDSNIIDGKTYSGFGGVNYSSRDIPSGPSRWPVQTYFFGLQDLIREGTVKLLPEFEWVLDDAAVRAMTWDGLRALKAVDA